MAIANTIVKYTNIACSILQDSYHYSFDGVGVGINMLCKVPLTTAKARLNNTIVVLSQLLRFASSVVKISTIKAANIIENILVIWSVHRR